MGCCISKCRPENNKLCLEEQPHHQQFSHVQDKLVISQAPPPPPQPQPLLPIISPSIIPRRHPKYKISTSPPSPTSSSTSSVSSFTCTASSNTISSASSLSSASSATLKDRSFSNEFLLSCYKENPHISRINSLREATIPLTNNAKPKPSPPPPKKPSSPKQNVVGKPCSPQHNVVGSFSTMPQKRVRSNSPTNLTRQKSFRKEQPDRTVRILGSPSPSKRFSNGGSSPSPTIMDTSVSKRIMNSSTRVSPVHYSRSVSSSLRKETTVNKAASSPNNNNSSLGRLQYSGLRHRETRTLRVGSKIDETAVKEAISNHDMHIDLTEDIDNPLISLDCFIFL